MTEILGADSGRDALQDAVVHGGTSSEDACTRDDTPPWRRAADDGEAVRPTGSPGTTLIILRGNSGSGKSTIARAVRERFGRGCALVEQDYLRRILLRERDVPGGHAAALIELNVRFALDVGYQVICEGILHRSRYAPMLTRLYRAHRGTTAVFYLNVSFEETVRRHAGRPQASEFTAEDMRGWYAPSDLLGLPSEQVITENTPLQDAVELIAATCRRPRAEPGQYSGVALNGGREPIVTVRPRVHTRLAGTGRLAGEVVRNLSR